MNRYILSASLLLLLPLGIMAHSGRTDSSGGHNCRVGSCAGTYHYHNAPAPREYYPPIGSLKPKVEVSPSPYSSTKKTIPNSSQDNTSGGAGLGLAAAVGGGAYWLGRRSRRKE